MSQKQIIHRTLQALGLVLLAVAVTGVGALYYVGHLWSRRTVFAPVKETREFYQLAVDPQQLFPGQSRINILCMGLDRNWTNKDLPYSKSTRTDTMMMVSLDLPSQEVHVLSVPRDMRVEIPDHGYGKINDAYRLGGVDLIFETIENYLGIRPDYYVVVKLGAVQRFVDAIGGVTLNVEKDMDYDDHWGQLFIHLKKGVQHLKGEQVEGYMRFRHDAESDFGRMRRQQQTMRAVLAQLQAPAVAVHIPKLIDAFNRSIETNLSRDQLLALAHLFHSVRPDAVISDSLPGREQTIDGISYLAPIESRQKTLVDWLLRGDETAGNRLTTVEVWNGCNSRKTTNWVVKQLQDQEFHVIYAGRTEEQQPITRIEGRGRHPDAEQRVGTALQFTGKGPWQRTPEDPIVKLVIGKDQVPRANSGGPT